MILSIALLGTAFCVVALFVYMKRLDGRHTQIGRRKK